MSELDDFTLILIGMAIFGQVYLWIRYFLNRGEIKEREAFLGARRQKLDQLNGVSDAGERSPQKWSICRFFEVLAYLVLPCLLYQLHIVETLPINVGTYVLLLAWYLIPASFVLRQLNRQHLINLRLFNTNLELRKFSNEQV